MKSRRTVSDLQEQYMTPEQVADLLQVHRRTVYNWLRSGTLNGIKIGERSWRISATEIKALAKARSNGK